MRSLDIAGLRGEQAAAAPVAMGRPDVGPLISGGADRLVGLELDELLEDERHRVAHNVGAAAAADGVEQSDRADCDRAIGWVSSS